MKSLKHKIKILDMQKDRHTVQKAGCTVRNVSCTEWNVGCNTLIICQGPGCPLGPRPPPLPQYMKKLEVKMCMSKVGLSPIIWGFLEMVQRPIIWGSELRLKGPFFIPFLVGCYVQGYRHFTFILHIWNINDSDFAI